ncbi:cell surface protein [Brachyspira sp. SAP_772]|uniref:cell surface protein n=1 Tax=Brachyspira sp. SAP_772 TaxID=2608385 RepID=UPI0012F52657|nr:cell surface protein [Brachyspira sp. SAP_772]
MKKVLLTAMVVLTVASASVFGMYGKGDSWIDFLVHGNQFRARMDQLGFVLGNGTIKGTFGLRANTGYLNNIINSAKTNGTTTTAFMPTLSAGIGYTSEMIGVGVGYNFTYIDKNLQVHTPVLMINALNNNLRISAPIQVAVSDKYIANTKYTGVAFDNIQLRYYTGIDAFNAIRLYAYYRNNTHENTATGGKTVSEAFGLQARFYFLNTQVGDVGVNPYVRVEYHTALKGSAIREYKAEANITGIADNAKQSDTYDVSPYEFAIKPVLALYANSDIVSFWFEPSLGYTLYGYKQKATAGGEEVMTHALTWGAYAEIYVTPVKDLEWYFEMDVNGNIAKEYQGGSVSAGLSPVYFETTTGITWYLPAL